MLQIGRQAVAGRDACKVGCSRQGGMQGRVTMLGPVHSAAHLLSSLLPDSSTHPPPVVSPPAAPGWCCSLVDLTPGNILVKVSGNKPRV